MRILLLAAACQPGRGPAPEVGWSTVQQVARHHQVWVLTHTGNRAAIEAETLHNPLPRAQFCYVDGLTRRPPEGAGRSPAAYLWQVRAYLRARRLHAEIGFDLAHQVGPADCAAPGLLALLPVPFVWGPVAGGEPTRPGFGTGCDRPGRLGALWRRIAAWDPLVRRTARGSAIVLAATRETALRVQALGAAQVELRGAFGLSAETIDALAGLPRPSALPIRFVSIGELRPGSGLALGLTAFAEASLPDAEYWVVGDGPQRRRLQRLARRAGIADRVHFCGRMARAEVVDVLRKCHVLVHPALQDEGGSACLDAMAAGRPVICLDLGAPALQVTDQTGVKVPAHAPEQAVRDLAQALRRLAADPELRRRLGDAGRARVRRTYDWNAKGRSLVRLYEQILAAAPTLLVTEPIDAHPGGSQSLSGPRRRRRVGGGGAGAPAPEWP